MTFSWIVFNSSEKGVGISDFQSNLGTLLNTVLKGIEVYSSWQTETCNFFNLF